MLSDGLDNRGGQVRYRSIRHERRRVAEHEVSQELLAGACPSQRQPMDSETAKCLFTAILRGNQSLFGLVKLVAFDLDGTHCFDSFSSCSTLLAYSVAMEQDKITWSLLRAGADPTRAFGSPASDLGIRIKQHLMKMNSGIAVWVVKVYCRAVLECRKEKRGAERCQQCGKREGVLLHCRPCHHSCCSDCFWHRTVLSQSLFTDTPCPVCGTWLATSQEEEEEEEEEDRGRERERERERGESEGGERGGDTALWGLPPQQIARVSKERFESLPLRKESLAEKRKAKRSLYCKSKKKQGDFAVPARHLAGRFIGDVRPQRTTSLFRAVAEGFTARVCACIEQGCDLEAVNEYGNTALLMASWHGRVDIVALLLRSGADGSHLNHTGESSLDIATSMGSRGEEVLAELHKHTLPRSPASIEPTPAWHEEGVGWTKHGTLLELVPAAHLHLARASYVIDDAFTEPFLSHLEAIFHEKLAGSVQPSVASSQQDYTCVVESSEVGQEHEQEQEQEQERVERCSHKAKACSDRAYFSDLSGLAAVRAVGAVLRYYTTPTTRAEPGDPPGDKGADGEREGAQVVRLAELDPETPCDHLTSLTANYRFLHHSAFMSAEASADEEAFRQLASSLRGGQVSGEADTHMFADAGKKRGCGLSVLLPGLRYLHYTKEGSCSPPHTDLAKTSPCYLYGDEARGPRTVKSTHTFILYLSDCHHGGETALLKALPHVQSQQQAKDEGEEGERETQRNDKESSPSKRRGTTKQREAAMRRGKYSLALQTLSRGYDDTHVCTSAPVCSGNTGNLLVSVRPRRGRILVFPHMAPHEGRPVMLGSATGQDNTKLLLRGEVL